MTPDSQLIRARMRHASIRDYYLGRGRTEQQWRQVSANPQKFNRVWRAMLKLTPGDMPPPEAYRR